LYFFPKFTLTLTSRSVVTNKYAYASGSFTTAAGGFGLAAAGLLGATGSGFRCAVSSTGLPGSKRLINMITIRMMYVFSVNDMVNPKNRGR
jgi:hypothetical protein